MKTPVVKRVIDADTVEVVIGDDTKTIRLLNIDTPETSSPAECLSEEAYAFTESLLPPGEEVTVEFADGVTDGEGADLAHVKLEDGRYVSDEIARAGLGDAVEQDGANERFAEVHDALVEASESEEGFFDPEEDCTFAAQVATAEQVVEQARSLEAGSSAAEATAAAIAAYALAKSMSETRTLAVQGSALMVRVFSTVGRSAVVAAVVRHQAKVKQIGKKFAKVKKKRVAKAKAKKAAKARAAAAAEAARLAALANQRRRAAPKPGGGSGGSNPYPGYTGPRCYAPGGKTWRPC